MYDPAARLLGTTYVVSVAYVSTPPGITSSTPDAVFGTTFQGYSYLQVSFLCFSSSRLYMVNLQGWTHEDFSCGS